MTILLCNPLRRVKALPLRTMDPATIVQAGYEDENDDGHGNDDGAAVSNIVDDDGGHGRGLHDGADVSITHDEEGG